MYSYVLKKEITVDDFAHEYAQANAEFFDAADETDLTTAAAKDEKCTALLDEFADFESREGSHDGSKMMHVISQAEDSTKERADVLREMISVRHRTRKAARDLALTKNGFAAANAPPHVIGETVPHGHLYGAH
jgi:hypothetical protein